MQIKNRETGALFFSGHKKIKQKTYHLVLYHAYNKLETKYDVKKVISLPIKNVSLR